MKSIPYFINRTASRFADACRLLLVLGALTFATARAQGPAVVLNEHFTDGDFTFGPDANDANFIRQDGTTQSMSIVADNTIGGGNALAYTNALNGTLIVGQLPAGIALGANIGDKIVFSFDFRMTTLPVPGSGSFFRFGIYNHNGAPPTDGGSETNNDSGYLEGLGAGGGAGDVGWGKESPGGDAILGGAGSANINPAINQQINVNDSAKHQVRCEIVRAPNGVALATFFDGGLVDTAQDDNSPLTTFNEIAFRLIGAGAADYDNIIVQTLPGQCVAPPAGLLSWWPGEYDARDIWGGNHGTLQNGVTFAPGVVGQAFSFDGSSDVFIDPPGNDLVMGTNDFTLDAWVKTSVTGEQFIFTCGYTFGGNVSNVSLFIEPGNQHTVLFLRDVAGNSVHVEGTSAMNDGAWHHVAGSRQGTTGLLYVDGIQEGSDTNPSLASIDTVCGTAFIGGGNSTEECPTTAVETFFTGLIDEIDLVKGRALTLPEIQAIVAAGSAGKCRPQCVMAPAGLVSWFPGEGNANDVQGGHHGTLQNGTSFAPGLIGQAFAFDGADDHVSVADSPALHLTTFTIDAWVSAEDVAQEHEILTKQTLSAIGGNEFAYGLRALPGGQLEGRITDASGTVASVTSSANLPAGGFHHVAFSYDGAGLNLYLDGQPAGTTASSLVPVPSTQPVVIGAFATQSSGVVNFWRGLIDEVQLFNRALDPVEIEAIYNARSAGQCRPFAPIAHWRFDEAGGSIAHDSAGDFDGTLGGGAVFVNGGISGNAISLDIATDSFVNVGPSFPGFTSGDFSLVAWVNGRDNAPGSEGRSVLTKYPDAATNGFMLETQGGTGKAWFIASEPVNQGPASATVVTDGQWHQLVAIYRAGGLHSIYVDGSPAETSTASAAIMGTASPFVIGGYNAGGPHGDFTGLIDDVQVFDYALSDAQIDFLFQNPGAEFQPATYDLATDWSDTTNPNCTWTYRAGSNALQQGTTGTGDFNGAQPGWGPSSGITPVWFKSTGVENLVHDWQPGDVVVRTQDDSSGAGNGAGNVIWTSPSFDTISITGGVWEGREIGRGNDWFLYKNGALLTQGHVGSGDVFSRAHPFFFSAGSGGAAAVMNLPVAPGDVIQLELVKTSTFGDYVGVKMTITGSTLVASPLVTTNMAGAVAATTATLNGSVNPNGTEAGIFFEYGTTTDYGSATPAQNLGCGNTAQAASANPTGLTPVTTYHFRAVALTAAGRVNGEDAMFTTIPPPAVTTTAATTVRARRATLNGTINPHGSATMYHFEYGTDMNYGTTTPVVSAGSGSADVNVSVEIAGLDPGTTYHFQLVATVPGAAFDGGDQAFATLTPGTFGIVATNDFAPDANAVPTAAKFLSFGPPIIAPEDAFAFRATLAKNAGGVSAVNDTGIWADSPSGLREIAREGGAAPDTTTNFTSLGDPVLASGFRLAFMGKVKGPNAAGIWSNTGGALRLVARQGDPAPGIAGATFATFVSLGLPGTGGPVFVAKVKGGTPANSTGIWQAGATGAPSLVARTGVPVTLPAGQKTIKSLQFLPPIKIVNGQTRAFNAAGGLVFRAVFTDKTSGVVTFENGNLGLVALTLDPAPGTGGAFMNFGQPTVNDSGEVAFFASLFPSPPTITAKNDTGIWTSLGNNFVQVAREAGDAPGIAGAKFASVGDPVQASGHSVAYSAKLIPGPGGVTPADAAGIWSTTMDLVARKAGPAPGTGGALFDKFLELALPGTGGPVFLAKLKHTRLVSLRNDTGVWATDDAGAVSLVARTGDMLTVNGSAKTAAMLQFLPQVLGVAGQTRGFNDDGFLAFQASFTDHTQAIFKVVR